MRTGQKGRGEEDWKSRGIRAPEKVTGQPWGQLILKRMDMGGKHLCGHMVEFRALSSPGKGAGKSKKWTCGISSCHMVQGGEKGRLVKLVARE